MKPIRSILGALPILLSLLAGPTLRAQAPADDLLNRAEEELYRLMDSDCAAAQAYADGFAQNCPAGRREYCSALGKILQGINETSQPRLDGGTKARALLAQAEKESLSGSFRDLAARAQIALARELALLHKQDSAIMYLQKAENNLLGLNAPLLTAEMEKIYAITYSMASDMPKAIEHGHQGLAMLDRTPDAPEVRRARCKQLHNVGYLYYFQKDYATALRYMEASLELRRANGFLAALPVQLSLMASANVRMGKSENADSLFAEAERLSRDPCRRYYREAVLLYYTDFYNKSGRYNKALALGREIERESRRAHAPNLVQFGLNVQAEAYEKLGRFREAYLLHRQSALWGDTLEDESLSRTIVELEAAQKSIAEARAREALLYELDAKGDFLRLLAVGILGALAVLAASAFFLRDRLRNNRLLRHQARLLERANADKNRSFSILARDLRNPLLALYGSLEKNRDSGPEREKELDRLQKKVADTRELLDAFLLWASNNKNGAGLQPTPIDLIPLIQEELADLAEEGLSRSISLSLDVHHRAVVPADPKMLRYILRELLSKALQNTPPGGTVAVSLSAGSVSDSVRFSIRESGANSSGPTERDPGTGHSLVESFLAAHSAALHKEDNRNGYTTGWFELPQISGK
jgi:signal transduction histidine kinase